MRPPPRYYRRPDESAEPARWPPRFVPNAFSPPSLPSQVWAVPDQWSFPLDLPAPLLGIDGQQLADASNGPQAYASSPELADEFEVRSSSFRNGLQRPTVSRAAACPHPRAMALETAS